MKQLSDFATETHRIFFGKLVPGLPVLGVKKAGMLAFLDSMSPKEQEAFLRQLPHAFVEENQAHMYLLNRIQDFDEACRRLEAFLPRINTWAVSDIQNIKAFQADERTEALALDLLDRPEPYAIRTGMLILRRHFLKTDPHLKDILAVDRSSETVTMMTGWYLADLAVIDPETVLKFLDDLDPATKKRTIQKVMDSRRISVEWKERFRKKRKS